MKVNDETVGRSSWSRYLNEKQLKDILPVLAFSNQHLDISIHFFKRLLWKQGIFPTPDVREPILPFDKIHEETADMHIKKIMEIENRIRKSRT